MNWGNYWMIRAFAGKKASRLYLVVHVTRMLRHKQAEWLEMAAGDKPPVDLKAYRVRRGD